MYSKNDIEKLIAAAKAAMKNSHSPYSKFRVGAAVYSDRGMFAGCNIENASYGATICAEIVAVTKAVSEGARKIYAAAIIMDGEGPIYPCGICRQVLMEFSDDLIIYTEDGGEIVENKIEDLLPKAFTDTQLK